MLHTLLYVTWISPILFPAAPSQPLYSAVTLIAVTSVVSLLLVTSIIGGTLLLYRYFHKGMYKCEQSACYLNRLYIHFEALVCFQIKGFRLISLLQSFFALRFAVVVL